MSLNEALIRKISKLKNEPEWMLEKRLKGLKLFKKTKLPTWGPSLKELDFNKLNYYTDSNTPETNSWKKVPKKIKKTFDKLGIPEAEQKVLSGVGAQWDSNVIYHNIKESLEKQGVIFENMDTALKKYPELVKKYFMTIIPISEHKFTMLHAAVWSGGTFIYIPKNVKVDLPLQSYFRMNSQRGGQFEHTLIILEEGAELHYIEGCFTKGNLILTDNGYKPIEKIQIGEKVLTHDGTYKKVKEIFERPYKGILKQIKICGNPIETIEATEDHPFLYVNRKYKNERNKEWKPYWNHPRFFKKEDYLAIPINKILIKQKYKEIEIDKWTGKKKGFIKEKIKIPSTKEFFKLVGYYLAEGSISNGHYLNFTFSSKEIELINDIKKLLKKTFGITKISENYHNNGTNLIINSTKLCRIFEVFGKKANLKNIPQWMLLEDPKKQNYLIEGYYKGDGNYYNKIIKNNTHKEIIRINSVSYKLIKQCQEILYRLGIANFINARNRKKEGRQTMYTIGITGDHMIKFERIVGIKIQKKLNPKKRGGRIGITKNFIFAQIKSIKTKKVTNEIVYNLSIEKNETYCVNGVIVHNCSSPNYTENSLHAGCVEIYQHPNSKMRYSSIENWSKNVYNLNTKRSLVKKNAKIEWVTGNLGSKVAMVYPSSILIGENAKSESLGIAFANKNQNQDIGTKAIHLAPNTSSIIKSKSLSINGGTSTYRGLVLISKNAINSKSIVKCDALILDKKSISKTYPTIKQDNKQSECTHEATVGKIGEEEIFYLMSRGLSEEQATHLIVNGFISPIMKALPLEYALELNKLIEMEIEE